MLSIVRVLSLTIPIVASVALLGWAYALEPPTSDRNAVLPGAFTGAEISTSFAEESGDLALATAPCTLEVRGLDPGPSIAHFSVMSFLPGALQRLPAPDHPASIQLVDGEISAVIASNSADRPLSFTLDGGQSHERVLKFGEIVELESGTAVSVPAGVAVNLHTREAPALVVYSLVQTSSPVGGPVSPLDLSSPGVVLRVTEFPLEPAELLSMDCRDLL